MTAMAPEISVVIPCFNYGRYLGACLESILGQAGAPSFEVVVVDDGSTDDTREVLARFVDERIRVVHQENGGHAAAINRGLPLTRGRIVARIDPDDRYKPHFFATVHSAFSRHQDAALVYARAEMIDDAGSPCGVTSAEPHRGAFYGSDYLRLLERNFICSPTVAARREAWLAHLPVPGELAFHDWYFTVLIARDYPLCFVDDVVAEYRVHAANHHSTIARSGAEERSVLWMLDRAFDARETQPALERAKAAARRRIYAAHYLDFGDKYFGFGMPSDARRCYKAALRTHPASAARPDILRRLAATYLGASAYERAKHAWRAVRHVS